MSMMQDEAYMKRCLELAQLGVGSVAPNPMVGALLVYEGRIIGEGWHMLYGQAHAEVNCFDHVSEEDRRLIPLSKMYVSLEPCAHTGKTPPCAHRIVREGVKEIIIANRDPFKAVDGAGIEILKNAGATVRTGVLAKEGIWLNRRFFCFHKRTRPYIILKWAQSTQGFIAPADRSRIQLSNSFAGTMVHRWRTEETAIIVGYQTALRDNPQLTARHWPGNQPLRIAVDRQLTLPHTHHLHDGSTPTWILNSKRDTFQNNLKFVQLDFSQDILPQLMQLLYQEEKLSLIVEGGPALLNAFINAGLWDEARILRTQASITNGIAAPSLYNANLAMSTRVGTDGLQLWTNAGSSYAYCAGMSL